MHDEQLFNPYTLGQLLKAKLRGVPVEQVIKEDRWQRIYSTNLCNEIELPSFKASGRYQGTQKAYRSSKTSTGEKEMSLSQTEVNLLVTLANRKEKEDDLSKYTAQVPATLSADLQELMAEEIKENSKKAARTILNLLKKADAQTEADVAELRRLRNQEKAIKARIEERNRAKAYGNESQNYLPLTDLVEPHSLWDVQVSAKKVPEGWTPAAPAAEAAK